MTNKNYRFFASQDNKGNKMLVIIKGQPNDDLLTNAVKITDPNFAPVAEGLKNIMNHSSFKDTNKDGEKECK